MMQHPASGVFLAVEGEEVAADLVVINIGKAVIPVTARGMTVIPVGAMVCRRTQ